MAANDPQSRWHVERRINLGDVITSLTIFASVLMYVGNLDKRVTVLEASEARQAEIDARQDAQAKEDRTTTLQLLQRLDSKIDRIIESKK